MENQQQGQNQMQPQYPQIREVPTWKPDAQFTISGRELEFLYNYITGVTGAFAAMQNIMQRNIVNGNVDVEFDKLVTEGDVMQYVRVEGEEAARLKTEFRGMIDKIAQEVNNSVGINPNPTAVVAEPSADNAEAPAETAQA